MMMFGDDDCFCVVDNDDDSDVTDDSYVNSNITIPFCDDDVILEKVKLLKEKKRASIQNLIDLRTKNKIGNVVVNFDDKNMKVTATSDAIESTSIHVGHSNSKSSSSRSGSSNNNSSSSSSSSSSNNSSSNNSCSSSSSSSNMSNSSSGISFDDRYLTALQRMEMKKQQYEDEKVSFNCMTFYIMTFVLVLYAE